MFVSGRSQSNIRPYRGSHRVEPDGRPNSTGRIRANAKNNLSVTTTDTMARTLGELREKRNGSRSRSSQFNTFPNSPTRLFATTKQRQDMKKFPSRPARGDIPKRVAVKKERSSTPRATTPLPDRDEIKKARQSQIHVELLSPRTIRKLDRNTLELETQTLFRQIENLNKEKGVLAGAVEVYEAELKSKAKKLQKARNDLQECEQEAASSLQRAQEQIETIAEERDMVIETAERRQRDCVERRAQLEKVREQLADAGRALIATKQKKDQAHQAQASSFQARLQAAEEAHQSQLKSFEERVQVAEDRAETAEDETRSLEAQLKVMEDAKARSARTEYELRAKCSALNETLEEAEAQTNATIGERDSALDQLQKAKEEVVEKQKQIDIFREQLTSAGKVLMVTKKEKTKCRDEWKNERDEWAYERDDFTAQIAELERQLSEAREQATSSKKKLSERDNMVDSLRVELEEGIKRQSELELQVSGAQKSLSESSQNLSVDVTKLKKEVAQKDRLIESKNKEVSQMKNKLAEKDTFVQSLTDEAVQLKSSIAGKDFTVENLNGKLSKAKKRIEEKELQILALTDREQEHCAEIRKAEERVEKAKEHCLAVENKMQSMATEKKDFQERIDSLTELLNTTESEAKRTEDRYTAMKEKLETFSKKHGEYKLQIAALKKSEKQNAAAKRNLELQGRLTTMKQEIANATEKTVHFEEEISGLSQELETVILERDQKEGQLDHLEEEMTEMQEKLRRSEDQIVMLHDQLEAANKKSKDYKSQLSKMKKDLSMSLDQRQVDNSTIAGLQEINEATSKELDETRHMLGEQEEMVRHLSMELAKTTEPKQREPPAEEETGEQINERMKELEATAKRHTNELQNKETELQQKLVALQEYYDESQANNEKEAKELKQTISLLQSQIELVEAEKKSLEVDLKEARASEKAMKKKMAVVEASSGRNRKPEPHDNKIELKLRKEIDAKKETIHVLKCELEERVRKATHAESELEEELQQQTKKLKQTQEEFHEKELKLQQSLAEIQASLSEEKERSTEILNSNKVENRGRSSDDVASWCSWQQCRLLIVAVVILFFAHQTQPSLFKGLALSKEVGCDEVVAMLPHCLKQQSPEPVKARGFSFFG